MGKNKWARFKENETFSCLIQPKFSELLEGIFPLRGNWHNQIFKNDNPIVVEIGCGRGEYTIELAKRYPQKNFIGIDIKGARLWRGAKTATEERLNNVAFIRTKIDVITSLFSENEVSEIWITFPDPQPKKSRKRLCGPMFLNRYSKILQPNGIVHLKTDGQMLHAYTLAVLSKNKQTPHVANKDIHQSGASKNSVLEILTNYEKIFIQRGYPITYLQFSLPQNTLILEPDDFIFDMNVPKAHKKES
ncbi:MAG: tRNA (guanosine(46)-N7)-methyltransferase TrmB [Bacteroidales bacterium]